MLQRTGLCRVRHQSCGDASVAVRVAQSPETVQTVSHGSPQLQCIHPALNSGSWGEQHRQPRSASPCHMWILAMPTCNTQYTKHLLFLSQGNEGCNTTGCTLKKASVGDTPLCCVKSRNKQLSAESVDRLPCCIRHQQWVANASDRF